MLTLCVETPTPLHRVPAGFKLGFMLVSAWLIYALDSVWMVLAAFLIVLTAVNFLGPVIRREMVRAIKPLWIMFVIFGGWIAITVSPLPALILVLRLVTLLIIANLVTLTTPLDKMIDVLMTVLKPFEKLGLKTAPIALAIALVIRFVPVLGERTTTILHAWKARSTKRPFWRIVAPLTISAMDDAEHVSEALRARGGLAGK